MSHAIEQHMDNDDGYCTTCKQWTAEGGCEPDARELECEVCGENTVYGAEELLFMGMDDVVMEGMEDDDEDAED